MGSGTCGDWGARGSPGGSQYTSYLDHAAAPIACAMVCANFLWYGHRCPCAGVAQSFNEWSVCPQASKSKSWRRTYGCGRVATSSASWLRMLGHQALLTHLDTECSCGRPWPGGLVAVFWGIWITSPGGHVPALVLCSVEGSHCLVVPHSFHMMVGEYFPDFLQLCGQHLLHPHLVCPAHRLALSRVNSA